MEPKCDSSKEPKLCVLAFDDRVGEAMGECRSDSILELPYRSCELHEGREPAPARPAQPPFEPSHSETGRPLLENSPEGFHQQVGPVQRCVDLRDPGECLPLAHVQVLWVAPESPPRALQMLGLLGIFGPSKGIPDLSTDLIKGVRRPRTTWKVSMQRMAWGARSRTTSSIHAAPSALTIFSSAARSGPKASKKRRTVSASRPGSIQSSRPVS